MARSHSTSTIPLPRGQRFRRPTYQPPDEKVLSTNLTLTPTQTAFLLSEAETSVFMGSRGEGKTTGGVVAMLSHAQRQPQEAWPIVWAVVRDTWVYLRDTTIATVKRMLPPNVASFWSYQDRVCDVPPSLKILFFGMDQPSDANRFQSLELGGLWIEEPAPAADIATGLPAEVYGVGVTSLRQLEPAIKAGKAARHRCQITLNPPDEDHWVMRLQDDPSVMFFNAPPGEVTSEEYRSRNRAALLAAGRQDLVARLVEGKVGQVLVGLSVSPEFSETLHVADALPVLGGVDSFRWWDFGLNPTCIWVQMTPLGGLHVLDVRVGQNMGLEQFLEREVLPLQAQRYPGVRFLDTGDPAGFQREQANSEVSCAILLRQRIGATLRPGPIEWSARRDAVKSSLTRLVGGRPFVQMDRVRCRPLIRALRGGWRYATDGSGRVLNPHPVKDMHSHPGDAFGYGVALLMGITGTRRMPIPAVIPDHLIGDWNYRWHVAGARQ